jgi:hypothetical protein
MYVATSSFGRGVSLKKFVCTWNIHLGLAVRPLIFKLRLLHLFHQSSSKIDSALAFSRAEKCNSSLSVEAIESEMKRGNRSRRRAPDTAKPDDRGDHLVT